MKDRKLRRGDVVMVKENAVIKPVAITGINMAIESIEDNNFCKVVWADEHNIFYRASIPYNILKRIR